MRKRKDLTAENESAGAEKNDFSRGSVSGNILSLAIPMTLAQLINVLYSVVDRIYIGHIPGGRRIIRERRPLWGHLFLCCLYQALS